jgi:hypothetical protein
VVGQTGSLMQACKRLLTKPWTYAGAAVIALVLATSMALGGVGQASCSEPHGQVASRLSELDATYSATYRQGSAEIQACQSLDCERPAKLEIAAALRSYSQGMNEICWPTADQSAVKALLAANSSAAAAYANWADAVTPADDQVFGATADGAVRNQQSAARTLVVALQR